MARKPKPCLSHRPDVGEEPILVPIVGLPFRIGRDPNADLVLGSPRVSKLHAEIVERGDGHAIRDLGSRNGTSVNGEPLEGERLLHDGDIVHVAHRELVYHVAATASRALSSTWAQDPDTQGSDNLKGTRDIYRILRGDMVRIVFQSIVALDTGALIGFEALGRHQLTDATYDAARLFHLAHELGKAVELSRLMRRVTVEEVPGLPRAGERVFLNVHPAEMRDPTLLDELARTAEACPGRTIVAEIHESVISSAAAMRKLREELAARRIELAYDDFGAGSSRLMELAEAPPDFVKLDMGLIRDIDRSPRRQELVAALVKVMRDADVGVIAEGIETEAEHTTCLALGCELGQGFLIKHPASAKDLRDTWE
ncbi:MAG: EAL domain-containing protein [Sandaracinaceae bacterium]|nr:EAL domain-containing protein [Sandaracinaceae bacterium]